MRLTTIKLSGFKSFVDPVSIPVNDNLVGIVGPNGCGKSNIIDAVRWVMGESSAKHLRGGTMIDVIFNGSSTRKPIGMASVELIFDNSRAVQGGMYSGYSTIAIKRQVSRDGLSVYMLNGTKCRRKDIKDIFLGTGLGSRSYAIIEQGTISRLVDAKPDDLRILIEEAAGISKYKDRRHDTEIRIRHTRENLERLTDLREEIEKRLHHLKRQAAKAAAFKKLKTQERQYRTELLAIRWDAFDQQVSRYDHLIQVEKQNLDNALNEQAALDRKIADYRKKQVEHQQSMNAIQAELYAAGGDLGRVEESIRLCNRNREDIGVEISRLRSDNQLALNELEHDKQQLEHIRQSIGLSIESTAQAQALERIVTRLRDQVEQISRKHQEKIERANTRLAVESERVRTERDQATRMTGYNHTLTSRKERLLAELDGLHQVNLFDEISVLQDQIGEREEKYQLLLKKLGALKTLSDKLKYKFREFDNRRNKIRSSLQSCEGKMASLERLQQHSMGKDRESLFHWLKNKDLVDRPRLAKEIDVESGWETAVEVTLGSWIEAICVEKPDHLLNHIARLANESVSVIGPACAVVDHEIGNVARLTQKIRCSWNVHSLLDGIFCASDPEQAKLLVGRLGAGESVITPNGLWLGAGWISLNRTTDQRSGVLAREKELRELKTQRAELIRMDQEAGLAHEKLDVEAVEHDQQIDEVESSERELRQNLGEAKASLSEKNARHKHVNQRCGQIEEELADVGKLIEQNESLILESAGKQKTAKDTTRSLSEENSALEHPGRQLQNFSAEIRTNAAAMHDKANRLESGLETFRSSEQLASRHLQRLGHRYHQEIERATELEKKLAQSTNPLQGYSEERDQLLGKKFKLESCLKEARIRLTDYEKLSEQSTEQHAGHQQNLGAQRDQLEQVRLAAQENRARSQAVIEQLDEFNISQGSIRALLPQQANEETWREKVDKVDDKIRRLGAINLAAIEEFEEQSQRESYLSEQHEDLLESLETLERAMSKIDLESKTRFRNTFNQINEHLQTKFPKLFGGGHACLELTDTNLLETGVNVVACPPGKRNSSIHLLSGGEKALTAIALVFSIFELNPAPFCMLDEVDAPLDDVNVGRFSKLIEEMSERIQFIFITHNKVTMEAARHLTGVTMNEPGVSRMVVVDIDRAVEMAVQ